jgi:hypothetical protein
MHLPPDSAVFKKEMFALVCLIFKNNKVLGHYEIAAAIAGYLNGVMQWLETMPMRSLTEYNPGDDFHPHNHNLVRPGIKMKWGDPYIGYWYSVDNKPAVFQISGSTFVIDLINGIFYLNDDYQRFARVGFFQFLVCALPTPAFLEGIADLGQKISPRSPPVELVAALRPPQA